MQTRVYAAAEAKALLAPSTIERRAVGAHDVHIDILFSGICHSDIHSARAEWGAGRFPMVPGHEIVGRVRSVGANVTKVKVGDLAGVGCMVDSCGACPQCEAHQEQHCDKGNAQTYNSTEMDRTTPTYGGYAQHIVVVERFVVKVPAGLDPAGAAPLLCAGITTYSPLRQWGCGKGTKLGVIGLGGLGHMTVKIGAAMGAEVTVLSTSERKKEDAKRLGAAHFVLSADKAAMKANARQLDLLIDTVSATHDYGAMLRLLRPQGTMVCVGAPPEPQAIAPFALIGGSKRLVGSIIGGIKETQEMLEFCGERNITADVEVIRADQINEAYERTIKGDVRYRFSIDASTF